MAGTIRRNGDNSAQAIRRATIRAARLQRAQERQEERYFDERAMSAHTAAHSR